MHKKVYPALIIIFILAVSVLIMILPSFLTKGVSRVELRQELNLPLVLNDDKNIKLVFFGYAGCTTICTPRLQKLSKFYDSLSQKTKDEVGLEFLDISVPADETLPHSFANFFNKDFKGIYLNANEMRDYTRAFNVYFAQSLFDKKEFDHSSNLYIIKKVGDRKELRYVYTAYPFDFKQIKLDIQELQNE